MNKRSFLKLMASIFGAAAMSRLFGQDASVGSKVRLTNWSGNFAYSTDNVFRAESVDDVQTFLKEQTKMRALGTRHCFNNIADSVHQLVSVRALNQPVTLDRERKSITLQAGIRVGNVRGFLRLNADLEPFFLTNGGPATAFNPSFQACKYVE